MTDPKIKYAGQQKPPAKVQRFEEYIQLHESMLDGIEDANQVLTLSCVGYSYRAESRWESHLKDQKNAFMGAERAAASVAFRNVTSSYFSLLYCPWLKPLLVRLRFARWPIPITSMATAITSLVPERAMIRYSNLSSMQE